MRLFLNVHSSLPPCGRVTGDTVMLLAVLVTLIDVAKAASLQQRSMGESGGRPAMLFDTEEDEADGRSNWYQQQHPAIIPGCECWHWPECINNCSAHPPMKAQLITNGAQLARLPLPFVIVLPYQEKKSRLVHNTSTASRRGGTYAMHTTFWMHMLRRQLVKLDLVKSRIFGDQPNSYSTHYYQQNKDGQMYAIATNKLDHCFYVGTVRNESTDSYAAVDTCYGLRGLIRVANQTYGILPLRCTQCSRGQLPHVLFYHRPSPIDRDVRLPVFWPPTNMLSLKPNSQGGGGGGRRWSPNTPAVYTLRLSVILDHRLFVSFDRKLEQSVHYIASVVNQATKSFQGTSIDIHLVRSELWTMENHIPLPTDWNTSIKATLNELAAYSIHRISRFESVPGGSTTASHVGGHKATLTNRLPGGRASPGGQHNPWLLYHRRQRRSSAASHAAPNPSFPFRMPATPGGFNQPHDLQVLLSIGQFSEKHVEYLAIPDSICTPRSLAVIQVNISETVYHVSRLLSLAIAEVLGIKAFPCPSRHHCDTSDLFSEGDRKRLNLTLMVGMADCLLPQTQEQSTNDPLGSLMPHDTCGNGQVDRGEECDPAMVPSDAGTTFNQSRGSYTKGHRQQPPLLPCCNPVTCLVDAGAACVHGECCDRCQLVGRGRMCRSAQDQCDLPEFCTGIQSNCPADLYLENGTPCHLEQQVDANALSSSTATTSTTATDSSALCYHGVCPTRGSQCRLIWGDRAQKADDYCFSQHNTRTEGACGIPGAHCQAEHAVCGLLHCQGGEPRPVAAEAQAGQPFLTYTEHRGQQFECKHLSLDSRVRFVPEGAACDRNNNRYCFQQQCVSPSVLLHSKCPSTVDHHGRTVQSPTSTNNTPGLCSDNGVCTNFGFCLCRPGWTGKACGIKTTTTSNQLGTGNHSNYQYTAEHHLFDVDPHLLALEPDMVAHIWTYLDEVAGTASGRSASDLSPEATTRPVLNTMSLVLILVSVAGGIFVCLVIFVLCYRRRSRPGFPHKPNPGGCSSQCFFYPAAARRWHHRGRDTPGLHTRKSLFTRVDAATGSSSIRLLETTSVNSGSRLMTDDRDPYSKTMEAGADDRRLKRHRKDRGDSSRRRRRRSSTEEDTGGRSRRKRHRRRRDRSHGMSMQHHSDTEVTTATTTSAITFRDGDHPEGEEDSLDRIIKFGSMPSYREDKRKRHFQQSSAGRPADPHQVGTLGNANLVNHVTASTTPFIPGASASSSAINLPTHYHHPHVISKTSELSAVYQAMPPPPLFSHTSSNETSTNPLSHSLGLNMATVAEHLIIETAGRIGAAAAIRRLELEQEQAKQLANSAGIGDRFNSCGGSVAPDAESINSTHLDILLENSWRQPEKGILKNKNEGGGHVTTGKTTNPSVPAATINTTTGTTASELTNRRHQHSRRHRSRHARDADGHHFRSARSTSVCSDGGHVAPGRAHRSAVKQAGSREVLFGMSSSTNSSTSPSTSGSSTSGDSSPDKMGSQSSETGSTVSSSSSGVVRSSSRRRNQRADDTEGYERKRSSHHSASRLGRDNSKSGHSRRYRRSSVSDTTANTKPTASDAERISNFHSSSSCSSGPTTTTTTTSTLESGTEVVIGHRHWRRCRDRRRRRRRNDDDDVGTSGSQRSDSPLPTAPTILCNAGQQTDEIGGLNAAVAVDKQTTSRLAHQQRKQLEEFNSEWEECSASACEECQITANHVCGATGSTATGTNGDLRSVAPVGQQRQHDTRVCLPSGCGITHTPPSDLTAYRTAAGRQQQGPGQLSTSLFSKAPSVHKCVTGTNAEVQLANQQQKQQHLPADGGKLHEGLLLLSPSASSSNRFGASSSSTGSSSVGGAIAAAAGKPGGDRMLLTGFRSPGLNHHGSSNDDHVGQNSDPEVDAHLTAAARVGLHNQLLHRLPTAMPKSPDDSFGYVVVGSPGHRQQPSALTNISKVMPMERLPDCRIGKSSYYPHPQPGQATVALTGGRGETFYEQQHQHPYEEVATDDYADASCSNFTSEAISRCPPLQQQQQQHIYYQHGLLLVLPNSDGRDSATAVAPFTDEDERLSLDDGGGGSRGNLNPLCDNSVSVPPVPGGLWSGLGTPMLRTNGQQLHTQCNMHSVGNKPGDCQSRQPNTAMITQPLGDYDDEDSGSEFSLSAFRRSGDNRLPVASTKSSLLVPIDEPPSAGTAHSDRMCLSAARDVNSFCGQQPHFFLSSEAAISCGGGGLLTNGSGAAHIRQDEVHSNDGTCNDGSSDTSSLPEAGCDLVQLAQLTGAGCVSTTTTSAGPTVGLGKLNHHHHHQHHQLMSRRY